MTTASDKILHITDWIPLTDIPSVGTGKSSTVTLKAQQFWDNLCGDKVKEPCGVYQVSFTRPESIYHEDIGYIGQSTDLRKRVYNLASNAKPDNLATHHQCGVYLRHSNIDPATVYVRMIFTTMDAVTEVERALHDKQRFMFNHSIGYAWEEASGGVRSCRITAQSAINRCDLNTCLELKRYLEERIILLEREELNSVVGSI